MYMFFSQYSMNMICIVLRHCGSSIMEYVLPCFTPLYSPLNLYLIILWILDFKYILLLLLLLLLLLYLYIKTCFVKIFNATFMQVY